MPSYSWLDKLPSQAHDAQEKLPDGEQLDPVPSSPPEETEEKHERSLSVLWAPHLGHLASFSSLLEKHRYSNSLPHSLHLNSYIGISTTPPVSISLLCLYT